MKSNRQLAQIVAERLYDRYEEEMMEVIQDLTTDVLEENGIELDDDGWEVAMDVAGRIYIGAQ